MPYKFRGGVHPDYMKAPNEPVVVITPPPQVVIPMAQHIGAPCQPIVKVGDYVTMGQKIGDNPAPVSAPVHSPVSGKVIAIEPRPHPLGDMIMAIVIENDYQDTPCTDLAPLTEEQLKDPEAILTRLREAGIVGMGRRYVPHRIQDQRRPRQGRYSYHQRCRMRALPQRRPLDYEAAS